MAKAKKKVAPASGRSATAGRTAGSGRPRTTSGHLSRKRPGNRRPSGTSPSVVAGEISTTPMSRARQISWWALLAMVFIVPIATSNFTVLGAHHSFTNDVFEIVKVSVLRIFTCIALGAWAWDTLRRGGRIRHLPLDWLVIAFVIWVAISTATSVHLPTALLGKPTRYEGLLTFVNYALVYFLVLQLADHSARVRRLAQALFWSSILVAGFGLLQYLGVTFSGWVPVGFEANRAFSTYGNPDFLGGFLIFSTTIALGLVLLERRRLWRLIYWAGFGLNGLALIASFTRGAWIGGVVSLLLLGIIAWRQRASMRRLDWVPAGISFAVGIGIIARSLSSSSEVLNVGKRIASIFEFSAGSGQSRLEIWRAALAAIADRPVLGFGPDSFRLTFHKFKTAEYVRVKGGASGADNAHNYLLQLATGVGILGTLMFCAIFVWAGARSFTSIFRRSDDPLRLILGAFWSAAVGYLIHLFFGLSLPGGTFLLWIALAVVLVPTARSVTMKRFKGGTVVATVIIVIAAAAIGYQGTVLAADNAYAKAQIAGSAGERVTQAQRAVAINPLNADYRQSVGLAYLEEMGAYLRAGAEAQQRGEDTGPYAKQVIRSFRDAEAALKKTIEFIPAEYDNYVVLATLYNLGGETIDEDLHQSAMETVQRGLEIMPLGTSIRVQLARALVATNRVAEAIEVLEYCVEIDPGGGEAALRLSNLYRQMGRTHQALEILRRVQALAPGQEGVVETIKELEAEVASP